MKPLFRFSDKTCAKFEDLFKSKKYLWLSLSIASVLMSFSFLLEFSNPLPLPLSNSSAQIDYISDQKQVSDSELFESVELFDSSPLFIPTKWNFTSYINPEQTISNMTDFPEFEPIIVLDSQLKLPANLGLGSIDLMEDDHLFDKQEIDLRILGFDQINPIVFDLEEGSLLSVELLDEAKESLGGSLFFRCNLAFDADIQKVNPAILLVKNHPPMKMKVVSKLYQSSSTEAFDSAILSWVEDPENIAKLPNGFLKLTFYP